MTGKKEEFKPNIVSSSKKEETVVEDNKLLLVPLVLGVIGLIVGIAIGVVSIIGIVVGIIMMDFKGEYTRFENPEDNRIGHRPPTDGGEIIGSSMNDMPFPPPTDYNPFNDKA